MRHDHLLAASFFHNPIDSRRPLRQPFGRLTWPLALACGVALVACDGAPAATDDAGAGVDAGAGAVDAYVPPGPFAPFRSVTASAGRFCATTTADDLWCWDTSAPPRRVATNIGRVDCSSGGCCSLTTDGRISCWLGDGSVSAFGSSEAHPTPIDVTGATDVRVGGYHACALLGTGQVTCWGSNLSGELGRGPMDGANLPPAVVPAISATAIGVGFSASYAIRADGTLAAWGDNLGGELGLPPRVPEASITPVTVSGLGSPARSVEGSLESSFIGGSLFACAVLSDGRAACWGTNSYGELSGGTATDSGPVVVDGLSGVAQVSVGFRTAVARLESGEVYQWGTFHGEAPTSAPVRVGAVDLATDVAAGQGTACAVTSDAHVVCWGGNPVDYAPSL